MIDPACPRDDAENEDNNDLFGGYFALRRTFRSVWCVSSGDAWHFVGSPRVSFRPMLRSMRTTAVAHMGITDRRFPRDLDDRRIWPIEGVNSMSACEVAMEEFVSPSERRSALTEAREFLARPVSYLSPKYPKESRRVAEMPAFAKYYDAKSLVQDCAPLWAMQTLMRAKFGRKRTDECVEYYLEEREYKNVHFSTPDDFLGRSYIVMAQIDRCHTDEEVLRGRRM